MDPQSTPKPQIPQQPVMQQLTTPKKNTLRWISIGIIVLLLGIVIGMFLTSFLPHL